MTDTLYIDLAKPYRTVKLNQRRATVPGDSGHRFKNPKLQEMTDAGFVIEKNGSRYEVWHNKLMPGSTHMYRTLKEIDTEFYLELVK